jgi:hypothetical protein
MMLGGLAAVYQASVLDGLPFDPFSFQQDGLAAPEVDVGRGEVGDGLVVSQVVVVGDEGGDLGLEIAGKIVVLQQDPVLERLVPALDLALGLGMEGSTADMAYAPIREPFRQVAGDVARAVVAQQSGSMRHLGTITA